MAERHPRASLDRAPGGRWLAALALACALGAAQCWHGGDAVAAPAPGAAPPLVDGVGTWDLRALGSGPIPLSLAEGSSRGLPFRIPPGAGNRQRGIESSPDSETPGSFTVAAPKGMSYLLGLNVLVELAPDSGPGTVSITGQVNDHNATEVLIEVRRERRGRLRASWRTYDLIAGQRSGALGKGPARVLTENYTSFNSVLPGLNELRFDIERTGQARLARATVLADSGLRTTWRKPARLKLSVEPRDDGEMKLGRSIGVDFTIANIGDVIARDVGVRLRPLSKKATALGRREYRFERLAGAESGTFFLKPKREGPVRLELVAQSANANSPGGYLDAEIGSGAGARIPAPPWLLALMISGLAMFGWRRWRARRARGG